MFVILVKEVIAMYVAYEKTNAVIGIFQDSRFDVSKEGILLYQC